MMWQTVELREIRVFLAVAEELHFGRAAEQLGVTQSRVSQSLRDLETKLGQRLVHRTSRRVELTAAGESFLTALEPAHEGLTAVLRQAGGNPIEGELRLGLPNATPQGRRLIEAMTAFEEHYPESRVEVKEVALMDRYEPLRNGDVDLMVGRLPLEEPDLELGPTLPPEPRVLAVASEHPLSGREEVTSEDIADYEIVDTTGVVPAELEGVLIPSRSASGRPMKRRRLKHHDWSELVTMIARGKIVHPAFTGQFAHPSIRCLPIADLPAWESALVWRRGDRGSRLRAFVEVAERVLA
jgi:DNA-binding transcriptional LysR family regulator